MPGDILMRTLVRGVDVPGYASLLVAVLFFGSLQLIGIGLLGEYVGRIDPRPNSGRDISSASFTNPFPFPLIHAASIRVQRRGGTTVTMKLTGPPCNPRRSGQGQFGPA